MTQIWETFIKKITRTAEKKNHTHLPALSVHKITIINVDIFVSGDSIFIETITLEYE